MTTIKIMYVYVCFLESCAGNFSKVPPNSQCLNGTIILYYYYADPTYVGALGCSLVWVK